MNWVYAPISVRIKSQDQVVAHSGVHLRLLRNNEPVVQLNFTVSALPQKMLTSNQSQFYLTSESLVSDEEIKWYETKLDFIADPVTDIPGFQSFLQSFKNSGFRLLPQEYTTSALSVNIISLKSVNVPIQNLQPIKFVQSSQHSPIQILGFPFNFTNPVLFSNFRLNGFINHISPFGYLSDIKYIDNLLGAVANTSQDLDPMESLGLVLTNLRKFNGDGDLIFILSWNVIWQLIDKHFKSQVSRPTINKLSNTGTLAQTPSVYTNKSILPILLSNPTSLSWGTCIVLDNEYLITNHHVLKGVGDRLVYLSPENVMDVSEDTVYDFKLIDLSFIKLSLKNQFKLKNCNLFQPITYTLDYSVNDEVTTVGYGLFFNHEKLTPIHSQGHILAKQALRFHNNSKVTSLVITSAGCWNGSSGGGLFKGQNLLGLICSNAQINQINLDTNQEFSEKLTKFCFILPIEIIMICFEHIKQNQQVAINEEFLQWWGLATTHTDTFIDLPASAKL